MPQPLVMSSPAYLGTPTERTEIRIAYDDDFIYAAGRFFILFYHDYRDYIGDLNEAQLISIAVLLVTVPLLGLKARIGRRVDPDSPLPPTPPSRPSRPGETASEAPSPPSSPPRNQP